MTIFVLWLLCSGWLPFQRSCFLRLGNSHSACSTCSSCMTLSCQKKKKKKNHLTCGHEDLPCRSSLNSVAWALLFRSPAFAFQWCQANDVTLSLAPAQVYSLFWVVYVVYRGHTLIFASVSPLFRINQWEKHCFSLGCLGNFVGLSWPWLYFWALSTAVGEQPPSSFLPPVPLISSMLVWKSQRQILVAIVGVTLMSLLEGSVLCHLYLDVLN